MLGVLYKLAQYNLTLYHNDVMGVKVGTKWKIYMETCMFYSH